MLKSKVLIVGTPSEGLIHGLRGSFEVQSYQDPAEVIPLLEQREVEGVIYALNGEPDAINFVKQVRAIRSSTRIAVILRPDWSPQVIQQTAAIRHILFFTTNSDPTIDLANLTRFFQEKADSGRDKLLEKSANGTVTAFFEVLSIIDPYSASLGQRLRYATDYFCKSTGLELTWELETSALLAEIGALTIPVRVMMKMHSGQDLSAFERDMLARIPERGADLLQQIPCFSEVSDIVRHQGKNFNGSGLPSNNSLAGERIPKGARILKVLNDLFKLKENGQTQDQAIDAMEGTSGRYDPALLNLARDCFKVSLPENIASSTIPLTLKELRPGQLLVSNVETDDGVLVIRDGQLISPRLLHKLRNFAFTSGIKEPIYAIDLLESRTMSTTFHKITQPETAFSSRDN